MNAHQLHIDSIWPCSRWTIAENKNKRQNVESISGCHSQAQIKMKTWNLGKSLNMCLTRQLKLIPSPSHWKITRCADYSIDEKMHSKATKKGCPHTAAATYLQIIPTPIRLDEFLHHLAAYWCPPKDQPSSVVSSVFFMNRFESQNLNLPFNQQSTTSPVLTVTNDGPPCLFDVVRHAPQMAPLSASNGSAYWMNV